MNSKKFHEIIIDQTKFKNGKMACGLVQFICALSNYIGLRISDKFIQRAIDHALKEGILTKQFGSDINDTSEFILNKFNSLKIFDTKVSIRFFKLSYDEVKLSLDGFDGHAPSPVVTGVYTSKAFKADANDDAVIQGKYKTGKGHLCTCVRVFDIMGKLPMYKLVMGLGRKNEIISEEDIPNSSNVMNFGGRFEGIISR